MGKIISLIFGLLLLATPVWAITLNWDDNSTVEDGFAIEQLGPGGWAEIARVGTDIETYEDAASEEGCYRVRAFRDVVDYEIVFSIYSNTACLIKGATSLTIQ